MNRAHIPELPAVLFVLAGLGAVFFVIGGQEAAAGAAVAAAYSLGRLARPRGPVSSGRQ